MTPFTNVARLNQVRGNTFDGLRERAHQLRKQATDLLDAQSVLERSERDLDVRELGLNEREQALRVREAKLAEREQTLQQRAAAQTQREFTALSETVERKLQQARSILAPDDAAPAGEVRVTAEAIIMAGKIRRGEATAVKLPPGLAGEIIKAGMIRRGELPAEEEHDKRTEAEAVAAQIIEAGRIRRGESDGGKA